MQLICQNFSKIGLIFSQAFFFLICSYLFHNTTADADAFLKVDVNVGFSLGPSLSFQKVLTE